MALPLALAADAVADRAPEACSAARPDVQPVADGGQENGRRPSPAPLVCPGSLAGVKDDCAKARGVRVGMPWQRTLGVTLLTLIALWGAGSLLSFMVNRQHIVSTTERAQQLVQHPAINDEQLMALQLLRNDIGRLQIQSEHGAPWYQRFGLDHNAQLAAALMPWYTQANNRLIRDAAVQVLTQSLTRWQICHRAIRNGRHWQKRVTTN